MKKKIKTFILFSKRFYLFIFRERGREGEREGEKHQCVVASWAPLTGDLAHNPGMCPDCESNLWPFCLQATIHSTEPHQPGLILFFNPHPRICLLILETDEGEREKETLISCLLYMSRPRIELTTFFSFGIQDNTPANWTTWPGKNIFKYTKNKIIYLLHTII